MVWHSASFTVFGSISSPSVTAMVDWSEEKASSFPLFRFPSSCVEVIGWLKSMWEIGRLLSTSLRRSLPLRFALSLVRASSYRFFVLSSLSAFIIFLSKLQCGNPIYVVLMPVRSWLSRNKMLAKYPFAVKHVFRFRVCATDRFYFLLFSPLCSQFVLKFSLLRIPLKVFDKVQSVYLSHFYFHSTKLRKEPI